MVTDTFQEHWAFLPSSAARTATRVARVWMETGKVRGWDGTSKKVQTSLPGTCGWHMIWALEAGPRIR